ncbi:hypothetical protein LJC17_02165 [Acholeplasma sp. OttesenSCG-928-E16]|nr:hypothetical protein [Acholeplasma sp. OttesenSCG-928-E16]
MDVFDSEIKRIMAGLEPKNVEMNKPVISNIHGRKKQFIADMLLMSDYYCYLFMTKRNKESDYNFLRRALCFFIGLIQQQQRNDELFLGSYKLFSLNHDGKVIKSYEYSLNQLFRFYQSLSVKTQKKE